MKSRRFILVSRFVFEQRIGFSRIQGTTHHLGRQRLRALELFQSSKLLKLAELSVGQMMPRASSSKPQPV
jgi:hypothetical protein